ncbi:unnamed protein product [Schistocephalus solidus]|uniref:Rna-directed dna polymerase from mobile element jockey-like n=1 Tax=Schistocephalus solidus TaxID=70667 RepID=A0A183T4M5_SCHSO|nr:unnamed protein product [Schistocephalus solidus]
MYKLKRIEIRGNLLKSIENFLVGRRKAVCIGQERSSSAAVESAASRDSVHGSILFLIYVDDCDRDLDCKAAMFTKDMKIWSVIQSPADEDKLQINLTQLEEWSNHWLLRFNVNKCTTLRLDNPSESSDSRSYLLSGEALQDVETPKDLGVLMTTILNYPLTARKWRRL